MVVCKTQLSRMLRHIHRVVAAWCCVRVVSSLWHSMSLLVDEIREERVVIVVVAAEVVLLSLSLVRLILFLLLMLMLVLCTARISRQKTQQLLQLLALPPRNLIRLLRCRVPLRRHLHRIAARTREAPSPFNIKSFFLFFRRIQRQRMRDPRLFSLPLLLSLHEVQAHNLVPIASVNLLVLTQHSLHRMIERILTSSPCLSNRLSSLPSRTFFKNIPLRLSVSASWLTAGARLMARFE
jgi:hypothetical protein